MQEVQGVLAGAACAQGHPNFMYTKKIPPGAAVAEEARDEEDRGRHIRASRRARASRAGRSRTRSRRRTPASWRSARRSPRSALLGGLVPIEGLTAVEGLSDVDAQAPKRVVRSRAPRAPARSPRGRTPSRTRRSRSRAGPEPVPEPEPEPEPSRSSSRPEPEPEPELEPETQDAENDDNGEDQELSELGAGPASDTAEFRLREPVARSRPRQAARCSRPAQTASGDGRRQPWAACAANLLPVAAGRTNDARACELRQKAEEAGVDKDLVEEARDSEQPKEAGPGAAAAGVGRCGTRRHGGATASQSLQELRERAEGGEDPRGRTSAEASVAALLAEAGSTSNFALLRRRRRLWRIASSA